MLYSEIIAVCSQIHTKHIQALCGQNAEFVNVKLVVLIMTTGNVNKLIKYYNFKTDHVQYMQSRFASPQLTADLSIH